MTNFHIDSVFKKRELMQFIPTKETYNTLPFSFLKDEAKEDYFDAYYDSPLLRQEHDTAEQFSQDSVLRSCISIFTGFMSAYENQELFDLPFKKEFNAHEMTLLQARYERYKKTIDSDCDIQRERAEHEFWAYNQPENFDEFLYESLLMTNEMRILRYLLSDLNHACIDDLIVKGFEFQKYLFSKLERVDYFGELITFNEWEEKIRDWYPDYIMQAVDNKIH